MNVVSNSSTGPSATARLPVASASTPVGGAGSARIIGVDVARGLALLGMFAVHIFDSLHADNTPSKTQMVVAGHALATFVLLAGVSLTFITKRRSTGSLLPDAAALTARALFILMLGLLLNQTVAVNADIEVILPYYGMMFLLAIALLRRSSRVLLTIAGVLVLLAPLVVLVGFNTGLPVARGDAAAEPNLTSLAHPVALFGPLLVTGSYPVVEYMAFICVGMVIGRLDLADRRRAIGLTLGGVVLAASTWFASTLILFHLGGLAHLQAAAHIGASPQAQRNVILWDPDPISSWWWLVERAPYATSPFRMVHDIGVAMAVLGVSLLITRSRLARRALGPLAAAGAMTLTLYTAHVAVLSTSFLDNSQIALFVVLACAALSVAALWRRGGRRGPLEAAVTWTSARARRLVEPHPGADRKKSTTAPSPAPQEARRRLGP